MFSIARDEFHLLYLKYLTSVAGFVLFGIYIGFNGLTRLSTCKFGWLISIKVCYGLVFLGYVIFLLF